jgi:hypothetical protein
MIAVSKTLRKAVVDKFAQLLNDDVMGWYAAARRIDQRTVEEGIDLATEFDDADAFACSVVNGMRVHVDLAKRFPRGAADLALFETAEELFWHLVPHRGSDS